MRLLVRPVSPSTLTSSAVSSWELLLIFHVPALTCAAGMLNESSASPHLGDLCVLLTQDEIEDAD
eukprot:6537973-Prorocentrum_lima.AAC.1